MESSVLDLKQGGEENGGVPGFPPGSEWIEVAWRLDSHNLYL